MPETLEIGPFCPMHLGEEAGIWGWDGENEALYRLNTSFFEMLDGLGFRFAADDGAGRLDRSGAMPLGFLEFADSLRVAPEAPLEFLAQASTPHQLGFDTAASPFGVSADDLRDALQRRP